MKKYFDRKPPRKDEEKGQSTVNLTAEQLYSHGRLIERMKEFPSMFVPLSDQHYSLLEKLSPEQRMTYILTNLTREKSQIQIPKPKEVKTVRRLQQAAHTNFNQHLSAEILNTKASAVESSKKIITQLAVWLQTPAIYDLRTSHESRREWREKMIQVFDQGEGRSATGPFSSFYNRNIIAPNYSTPVFQSDLFIHLLKSIGLKHPSSEADLLQLSELSKQLREISSDDVQKRVQLILKKIRPLVFKILTKLARRPYEKTEVSTVTKGGLQKGSEPKDAHLEQTDEEKPDWLREQEDQQRQDANFDWSKILGEE